MYNFNFISILLLLLSLNLNLVHVKTNKTIVTPLIFEDKIIEILECIRGVLRTGIEEVGLPSMAPLLIPHMEVNVTSLGIENLSGYIIIDNTLINGLTDWELSNFHIDPSIIGGLGAKLTAKLNMPSFDIASDYTMDLTVSDNNIFGDGSVFHSMIHFGLDIDAKVLLNSITLSKFRLLPSLKAFQFNITGFMNDKIQSQLFQQMCEEAAAIWINEKSPDFADVIEKFLQGLINYYYSDEQILIVSGYGEYTKEFNIGKIINALLDTCL